MMKKHLLLPLIGLCLILISWGSIGHKTVANIAEAHLTPEAAANVRLLLGEQSMGDVASWADEVRNQPEYKSTAPWHYADVPLGLTYEDFDKAVKEQGSNTVYGAILKCEQDLKSRETTQAQKTIALKFLIHFIGDAHQPMHVSRPEDKGGNTIQVTFNGTTTNLHSLWDSGLINKQGQSIDQMTKADDTSTPAQIKVWQSQPAMQWLWESYQISTILYKEVEDDHGKLSEAYYDAHIPVVNKRIEIAGVRLAGTLNTILSGTMVNGAGSTVKADIHKGNRILPSNEAYLHLGESVKVTGKIFDGKLFAGTGLTLLNVGGPYPRQDLTIAIPREVMMGLPSIRKLTDKTITIEGVVVEYQGRPEITLTNPKLLTIEGL